MTIGGGERKRTYLLYTTLGGRNVLKGWSNRHAKKRHFGLKEKNPTPPRRKEGRDYFSPKGTGILANKGKGKISTVTEPTEEATPLRGSNE